MKVNKEPKWSLKELAESKGLKMSTVYNRAKEFPLPDPEAFVGGKQFLSGRFCHKSSRWPYSQLIAWFNKVNEQKPFPAK